MRKKTKRKRLNFALIRNHKGKIALGLFVVLVISIIIWTVSKTNNYIFGGGSTSVQPVLSDLTANYHNINDSRQVVYNSLGSQAAITGVENDSYSFGFLSKAIEQKGPEGANNLWGNYGIVPFVFGRDYVMMVYHLPNGLSLNSANENKPGSSVVPIDPTTGNEPESTSDAKTMPYLNFGGLKDDLTSTLDSIYQKNPTKSWSDLFGAKSFQGNNSLANDKPISITREEGSGTKEFFDGLLGPQGASADNAQLVATSNGSMLSTIENTPNSIGFISYSYLKEVKNAQLGIGAANKVKGAKPNSPYIEKTTGNYDFNEDYKLTRPFSGILNTRSKNYQASLRFIAWMLDYSYYAWSNSPTLTREPLLEDKSFYADYWYQQQGVKTTYGSWSINGKKFKQADPDWQNYNQNRNSYIVDKKLYPHFKSIDQLIYPVWQTLNGTLSHRYNFPNPAKSAINWNEPLMQQDMQRLQQYLDLD